MGNIFKTCYDRSSDDKRFDIELDQINNNDPSLDCLVYDYSNDITDDEAVLIAHALRSNRTVKSLIIDHGLSIGRVGYHAFADALEINRSVDTLSLQLDSDDLDMTRVFARMFRRKKLSLRKLDLHASHNNGVDGLIEILNSLWHNTPIRDLELVYVIDTPGMDNDFIKLGNSFINFFHNNKAIQKLMLFNYDVNCPFPDEFVHLLASGLQMNTSLTTLRIGSIGTNGLIKFASSLRTNKSLRHLDLMCENFDDDAVVAIFRAIEDNEALQTLNLTGRLVIGIEDINPVILKSLQYNNTLTDLVLKGTRNNETFRSIQGILEQNRKRKRVAPKKSGRKRFYICSWLITNSNHW
jgi:hypothetical protein